eukprot:1145220-Pelagomonas_calceolata.AAC.1
MAIMLFKAFFRCGEHCHRLASIEKAWPRAFAIKFFNSHYGMLDSNNETLLQVPKADLHLADKDDF